MGIWISEGDTVCEVNLVVRAEVVLEIGSAGLNVACKKAAGELGKHTHVLKPTEYTILDTGYWMATT